MTLVQPRKLLVFAFWEFRLAIIAISGDWLVDFRAMGLLVCTQICLIFSLLEYGSIMLGRRLIPANQPDVTLLSLFCAIAITTLNVYAITYKDHWKKYRHEFDAYSKLLKILGCILMIVLLGLGAATSIWLAAKMVVLPR
jgi:hypothetical protein